MLSDSELRKRSGASAGEPEMKRILGFAVQANMPLGNLKTNLKGMLKAAGRDYKALSGVTIYEEPPEEPSKTPSGTAFIPPGQPLPAGVRVIDPRVQ